MNFLAEMDMDKYHLQRRLIGPTYSAQQVKEYEGLLDKAVQGNVSIMREIEGSPKNVDIWFNLFVGGTRSVVQ